MYGQQAITAAQACQIGGISAPTPVSKGLMETAEIETGIAHIRAALLSLDQRLAPVMRGPAIDHPNQKERALDGSGEESSPMVSEIRRSVMRMHELAKVTESINERLDI